MRLLEWVEPAAGSRVPPSISLDDLLAATGGRLLGPTAVTSVAGAAVDSRQVHPGSLFVALRGERVDGHRFVEEALRNGAVAALVERPVELAGQSGGGQGAAVIQVADSLVALQELAAWWRSRSAVRVVGITGSTGKTIAKEIVADVLGRTRTVLRNEGNLNSETGLPMTLLELEPRHELAVLEMSMYTEGEIARLAELARPEVGVVLAVHPTHLERAGSIEAIARAKSELPQALPSDGLAVLNADDARVVAMASVTPATVRTYGLAAGADVRALDVVSRGLEGTEFTLRAPWGQRRLRTGMPGRHLVGHALAAAAVAERFAVPLDEVEAALAAGSRADHRMAVGEAASGATLVDDSYNASPISVAAALEFLDETPLAAGRRRLAVLGDMLELGPEEERLHREIGAMAAGVLDALLAVGARGAWIADAARAGGLDNVTTVSDVAEAIEAVDRALAPGPGDILLVKGSRGVELDRLVAALEATR
ncbi:MAG TPA: UDP-N-acetylmuramoyl-tripeptide--D-alanyl-D-alanine ligase [Candidatus Limnocylindria bacterium]|nr:UDP-N-acetylmuramoyl-tripeptide--D-alanyl-D-alanine ligase [Candidatus Limnocylindria bacterium]